MPFGRRTCDRYGACAKNRIVQNELIADDVALLQEQVYPVAGGRRRNHTGGNEP